MQPHTQLKYWQIGLQLVTVVALPWALYEGLWSWLGWMLLAYFVYGFFGITVGYHRLEAHRSFETNKFWWGFLVICGMLCSIASPLMNLLVHRTHHKYADTKRDSHSPNVQGWREAWFGEWMDRKVFLDPRTAKAEVRSEFYQKTHKYYVLILMTYAGWLLSIDWKAAVFLYVIPAALLFHVKGFFNTFGHTWGYRNYDTNDTSRNSWLVNLITVGDGWHNNHHADPSRWNISDHWYEVDFAAWFIRLIRKHPVHRTDDLQSTLKAATKK